MSEAFERTDEPALSPKEIEYLQAIMKNLAAVIETAHEPLDTKALALLEITHDMILQQIDTDIYHEWPVEVKVDQALTQKNDGQTYLFIEDDNDNDAGPTVEELNSWL